jgi:hypothetical protein
MSVFMTMFMMYMLGSSLNSIINITMLGAMVSQPVRTLMNMNKGWWLCGRNVIICAAEFLISV